MEDLTHITVDRIFNIMLAQIFKKISCIPEFEENPKRYREFFEGLNQIVTSIQVAFSQSNNLSKADQIIDSFKKSKNVKTIQRLKQLSEILHSSILIDSMQILSLIQKLMHYCSKNGLIFMFLFKIWKLLG